MNGSGNVRFSELFADTLMTHGTLWAWNYYRKHGMMLWEFRFWLYQCFVISGYIPQLEN